MPIQKCQADNQTAAEEKLAAEKRKQVAEESRAIRQKAIEAATTEGDQDVLDDLLARLRKGETVRKARRTGRSAPESKPANEPLTLTLDTTSLTTSIAGGGDVSNMAQNMLASLRSNGFVPAIPTTPTAPSMSQRRRRRRTENRSIGGERELPGSPLTTEIHDIPDIPEMEVQDTPDATDQEH
jgi:cytokinesis protein